MLTHLHIKNIAVIENLSVDFKNGMSVLTGETGAGKSIIIDSINLILGARTNKALVRYGEKKAQIQAMFDVSDFVAEKIEEYGIDVEDNQVIVSRDITEDGRSVSRINSVIVSTASLREIGNYLINIHGQHDNQDLLTPSKHIKFLDKFAKNDAEKNAYLAVYNQYREIEKQIDELSLNEQEKAQRMDLLSYQTNEIESAALKVGEYDELAEQRDIAANSEKISMGVSEAYANLYDGGETQSAYDGISMAVSALEKIKDYDSNLADIYDKLSDIMYGIEDYAHELKEYGTKIDYDENTLNDIEERLDIISGLKRKYGNNEEEILKYYEKAKAELETISDSDNQLNMLIEKRDMVEAELKKKAQCLTETRKKASHELESQIKKSLTELDMPNSEFAVNIAPYSGYSSNGVDNVEFMISTNLGEPLKPLVKVASGGELSRVMLAVKSILADEDDVDTMIFDEIDTGVSGSAAQKIAAKLSQIADKKQVICITHLAVLAAAADNHFLIQKNIVNDKTSTSLLELSETDRERELARIIDGTNITQTALSHAREMLAKSVS